MTSTVEANKALVYRYAQAVIDGDMQTEIALSLDSESSGRQWTKRYLSQDRWMGAQGRA